MPLPSGGPVSAELRRIQESYRDAAAGGHDVRDHIVGSIYRRAREVAGRAVSRDGSRGRLDWERRLDDVLTSRWAGIPVMLALLGVVFWITLAGANVPSELLGRLLFGFQEVLSGLFRAAGAPAWLHGVLVLGVYRCVAWVVAVMLPPMAIFFPLFTLLEDLGYLPRVAFNLDSLFRRAGAHGKQALTMSMGFGCNAAGVISCRIIESPRERLIAILTNTFVPCNGRFPTLIALAAVFFGGAGAAATAGTGATYASVAATGVVLGLIVLGVLMTLLVSRFLSRSVLRGEPSAFVLELPPYRVPQVGRVIVRSILDRTLFVLGRAVSVAAPAGALVWILANVTLGGQPVLLCLGRLLGPLGRLMGLDGFILTAFVLALPANEIVLPVLLMAYLGVGSLLQFEGLTALRSVLAAHGWTWLTAACAMLFSLMHFPCGTTLLTIFKETGSHRWTALAALLPTGVGVAACIAVAGLVRLVSHLLG